MNRRIRDPLNLFFQRGWEMGAVQPTTNETDAGCSLLRT
jgi:hypothetical protein